MSLTVPVPRHPSLCQWALVRSAPIMLNMFVVRHGQSEWNALGRWQGQADPPLSDLGRTQARGAAPLMGAFDAVVSSDLVRAVDTATIIADDLDVGPVLIDDGFRERNSGEYQGMTRKEIEERYPGNLEAWIRPPGWEPDESVHDRVHAALERIIGRFGSGDVLVVAHSGVIYALEGTLGTPHEPIANLGGRWFHHDGTDWRVGERVQLCPDDVTIENRDTL